MMTNHYRFKMKTCFKCNNEKPLVEFYKHGAMTDGYLGKCKVCTRSDTKKRQDKLSKNPEWVESEQTRHREKYHRLEYRAKFKPTAECLRMRQIKYKEENPEKITARSRTAKMKPKRKGNQLHHWSYNEEHYKDVIELTIAKHNTIHRFMTYSKEFKMYKADLKDNELLDTKSKHIAYIRFVTFFKHNK